MLFAYVGPETMYVVPSIIAGAVGVVMIFGRRVSYVARGLWRRIWPQAKRQ